MRRLATCTGTFTLLAALAAAPPPPRRAGELYSVYWDAVQADCVMNSDCSNTPVDVTKWGLRGTNWTQTAANQWDPAQVSVHSCNHLVTPFVCTQY